MATTLTTPVLQARDLILDAALHRKGLVLTEAVARDLANNAATALIALIEDLQRGAVVAGEIGAVPGPILTELTPRGREAFGETAHEHAERVIK